MRHFLIMAFQKLRHLFSLSSSSQAMTVMNQLILFLRWSQYSFISCSVWWLQNISCIANRFLLLFIPSSRGTLLSTSTVSPLFIPIVGLFCLMYSLWILFLPSITYLSVLMFSFSYRMSCFSLSLKMSSWREMASFIFSHISLTPWNTMTSLASLFSKLYLLMVFSSPSKVVEMSSRERWTCSQLLKRVSSCFLSRSQCTSKSKRIFVVLLTIFWFGEVGGITSLGYGSTSSPMYFGLGRFSQIQNSFFTSDFTGDSSQKLRIRELPFSSSFSHKMYFMNYVTIRLQRSNIQGSFPSLEATSQPYGSKQGSRKWGYIRHRIALSLRKSLNLRFIACFEGNSVMWYKVKSLCKKFRDFCSVLEITMSLIGKRAIIGLSFVTEIVMLDRLMGTESSGINWEEVGNYDLGGGIVTLVGIIVGDYFIWKCSIISLLIGVFWIQR